MKYCFPIFFFCLPFVLNAQPKISFTFDDGMTGDKPGYTFEEWNKLLLDNLAEANITTVLFVTGFNKSDAKGRHLLQSWVDGGHKVGNHTYSHPNYNSEKIDFENFKREFIGTDTIINKYDGYAKLFRFPYLKEGNTQKKVDAFRKFLKLQEYKNGHVTIDASDWYIDSRLIKCLRQNPDADISAYRSFYLSHILERAQFYESLAYELTGRHIKHTLLLHHNLTAALFLGDLIEMFKAEGWDILSADDAFTDPIFSKMPISAGESFIWSLAKDAGKFENILRYPGEDSRYEKGKMDKLGL